MPNESRARARFIRTHQLHGGTHASAVGHLERVGAESCRSCIRQRRHPVTADLPMHEAGRDIVQTPDLLDCLRMLQGVGAVNCSSFLPAV